MMAINGSLFSSLTYTIDSVSDKHRLSVFPGGVSKSDVFLCESKPALSFPCPPLKVSAQEAAVTFQSPVPASKAGLGFVKSQKWWEKGLQANMKDVTSAQDLADSLQSAGDKLVVVNFFSPGCGACKTLHPKMCQLAQMNPDIEFLLVNSEEHKLMCYTLRVHVLPFFRFYKGAHGRVCSFSCTTATIKKFKDAVARYNVDFCSIEPTKGLEEEELLALAANSDLSFSYTKKAHPSVPEPEVVEAPRHSNPGLRQPIPLPLPLPLMVTSDANQMGSPVSSGV